MAELNPWQPNALPFVAQLLRHLDAGSLPSEDGALPRVAAGRGHGTARHAAESYAPHVLEECLAGAREGRRRDARKRVRVTVVETTPAAQHDLRFALLRARKGAEGDELLNDRVALYARNGKHRAHCLVVPTRECADLHAAPGKGKKCRVAFLGSGVFVKGATLDVEYKCDALPTFRENSALMTLEAVDPRLLAPLLRNATAAPRTGPRTPAPLWRALRAGSNASQFAAVATGADAAPFALVQGPPGTGKTRTILGVCAALLHGDLAEPPPPARTRLARGPQMLASGASMQATTRISGPGGMLGAAERSRRILVTAPSNAAVDEVAARFVREGVPDPDGRIRRVRLCRVGTVGGSHRRDEVNPHEVLLRDYSLDTLANRITSGRRAERVVSALLQCDVVVATLSGCAHASLAAAQQMIAPEPLFDAVVVDEAAQAVEPSTFIPLRYGPKRVVLVGDPAQLAATLLSPATARAGYGQSLFERLWRGGHPTALLRTQYRMQRDLCALVSRRFYSGLLTTADRVTATSHALPPALVALGPPYTAPLAFHDIRSGSSTRPDGRSWANAAEARICARLAADIVRTAPSLEVGVVAPYRAQLTELRNALRGIGGNVEVSTVDAFQGREKDIVIVSCVRAPTNGHDVESIGFLADRHRLNVLLSRARLACWVVGHAQTLRRNDDWKAVVEAAERAGALFSERRRRRSPSPDRARRRRRRSSPAPASPPPPPPPPLRSTPCRATRAAIDALPVAAPPRSSERTAAMRRAREASARGEVIDVDAQSEVIVIQDDSESEASLVCRPKKVGKKKKRRRVAAPAPAPPLEFTFSEAAKEEVWSLSSSREEDTSFTASKATRAKADARAAMEARLNARLARKK